MKKLLLVAPLLVATAVALGQGTVLFSTRNTAAGILAPVYDTDTTTLLVGTDFKAQLYAGLTEASLAPVGAVADFKTGLLAGYVSAGTQILSWAGGTTVYVQMRAWNAPFASYDAAKAGTGGKWGESNTIQVKLTEPPAAPADLVGLQSFHLIPEPSTIALCLLGAAALLLRRRS